MATGSIKLRQRKMPSGTVSIYLDISNKGRRKCEYLKLYLVDNPQTSEEKRKNKETLRLAQSVLAQRTVDMQNEELGFKDNKGRVSFLNYFKDVADKKKSQTKETWESVFGILKSYCSDSLKIKDIDKDFLEGFKLHLDDHRTKGRALSRNSKWLYFSKVRACLNYAEKNGVISSNPGRMVNNFKKEEVERLYLSIEEIKLMINTPFKHEMIRSAFLFSCLTGLRWSDIESLKWGMVIKDANGNYRIHFRQEKTEGQEYLNINKQAALLMGIPGSSDDFVFKNITYSHYITTMLKNWAKKAGIQRHLTFHSARHSFAIMMIDLDIDLYVLSKLLGHKEIATTEIYAKVRDKKKQEAVNKIPDFSID